MRDLRSWLQGHGCEGLGDVEISVDGKPGVRLRNGTDKDGVILAVPQSAWIWKSVGGMELAPEAELAWCLVTELWLGKESKFAPYVDFLWGLDLSLHPAFWDSEELDWFTVSAEACKQLRLVRAEIAVRVEELVKRANDPSSNVPADVLADRDQLEADLRVALVLVEARAIEIEGASTAQQEQQEQPHRVVMAPILDHLAYDPRQVPLLQVGSNLAVTDEAMVAVASKALPARTELRQQYGAKGCAELLARHGCVTSWEPDWNYEEVLEANSNTAVALPIFVTGDRKQNDCLQVKLQLLAEYAGLDLMPGAIPLRSCLWFPDDCGAKGRMFPAARFLESPIPPGDPGEEEAACFELFQRFFERALNPEASTAAQPPPREVNDIVLEVNARSLVWEWCEHTLNNYQKTCKTHTEALAHAAEEAAGEQEEAPSAATPDTNGDTDEVPLMIDAVLPAHYKAKGPGGKRVKSKRPREARVLAVSEAGVTVQFLANGVRQRVPADWVIVEETAPAEPPPEPAELPPEQPAPKERKRMRPDRMRCVLAVLQNEAAFIELVYRTAHEFVTLAADLVDACKRRDEAKMEELYQLLSLQWEQEQRVIYGATADGSAASAQEALPQQVDASVVA